MISWIMANLATILISSLLIVIVISIIKYLIRQKRDGKTPADVTAAIAPCTVRAMVAADIKSGPKIMEAPVRSDWRTGAFA